MERMGQYYLQDLKGELDEPTCSGQPKYQSSLFLFVYLGYSPKNIQTIINPQCIKNFFLIFLIITTNLFLKYLLIGRAESQLLCMEFLQLWCLCVANGLLCFKACGIFPDWRSNPCPLLWQTDSYSLYHQESLNPQGIIGSQREHAGTSPITLE